MHSSLAIANEFIKRAKLEGRELTHMQLQKLVYLAHGWTLAVVGEPLVDEKVEAWDYGTVFRRLYDALCCYGRNPVTKLLRWGDDRPFSHSSEQDEAFEELTPQETAVLDRVWQLYGQFPAFKLSALTHAKDGPWEHHYENGKNATIPDPDIRNYFVSLATDAA